MARTSKKYRAPVAVLLSSAFLSTNNGKVAAFSSPKVRLLSTRNTCSASSTCSPDRSNRNILPVCSSDVSRSRQLPPLRGKQQQSDDFESDGKDGQSENQADKFVNDLLAQHEQVRSFIESNGQQNSDPARDEIVYSDENEEINIGESIQPASFAQIEAISKLASEQSLDIPATDSLAPQQNLDAPPVTTYDTIASSQQKDQIDSSESPEKIEEKVGPSKRKSKEEILKSIPSYRALLSFIITTVMIWLSEPILSLIDTTVVGRYGGAAATATPSAAPMSLKAKAIAILANVGLMSEAGPEIAVSQSVLNLASLGPATLLIDNCLYLTYFLSIATTNKIAKGIAKKDHVGLVKTASNVFGVGAVCGALMTALCWGFGPSVLSGIVGDSATVAGAASAASAAAVKGQVVSSALTYVKIRSSIGIFAVLDIVAQAICLASLDLKTPVIAVLLTSLTNIVGDWLLVVKFGMGIKGAAIATALANIVSCSILLRRCYAIFQDWKKKAADDIEDEHWKSGKVGIGVGDDANGNGKKTLPVGLGVAGSKARAQLSLNETESVTGANKADQSVPKNPTGRPEATEDQKMMVRAVSRASKGLMSNELAALTAHPLKSLSYIPSIVSRRLYDFALIFYVLYIKNAKITKKSKLIMKQLKKKISTKSNGDGLPKFISLPRKDDLFDLFGLAGPIFGIILLKVTCYSFMTLRAGDFGMLSLASHNVLLRVFFFYTTFGDAFSQAGQTFLPDVIYGNTNSNSNTGRTNASSKDRAPTKLSTEERRQRIKGAVGRMMKLAGIAALLNAIISNHIVQNYGNFITSDQAVVTTMKENGTLLSGAILLHPLTMLFEGGIMASGGRRGLLYLLRSYSATIVLLWSALKFFAVDLSGVWSVWLGFQGLRMLMFGLRMFNKVVREVEDSPVQSDGKKGAIGPLPPSPPQPHPHECPC